MYDLLTIEESENRNMKEELFDCARKESSRIQITHTSSVQALKGLMQTDPVRRLGEDRANITEDFVNNKVVLSKEMCNLG